MHMGMAANPIEIESPCYWMLKMTKFTIEIEFSDTLLIYLDV